MFVLLNGAFGIGKTTVACAMKAAMPAATIFDPEPVGIALQRIGRFAGFGPIDDFQDLATWRNWAALGARLRHRGDGPVVIPMAFSNRVYFDRLVASLSRTAQVRAVCLIAPLAVVEERLRRRAAADGGPVDAWALRRAGECCAAHVDQGFGRHIDATQSVECVVSEVLELSGPQSANL